MVSHLLAHDTDGAGRYADDHTGTKVDRFILDMAVHANDITQSRSEWTPKHGSYPLPTEEPIISIVQICVCVSGSLHERDNIKQNNCPNRGHDNRSDHTTGNYAQ